MYPNRMIQYCLYCVTAVALVASPASLASSYAQCPCMSDAEKGTLGDIREIVNLARNIRDLLKSTPKSSDGDKAAVTPAEIREFIALAREVRDLVNETTKSTEAVSVRDLSGLLTTIGPIYEMVKATPEASQEKIGIVEVAAAVALAREIRDLTKAADGAKSVDKIGIAEVAAAVAIAREVKDLFKTLPIDETKGFGVSVGGAVSLPGISAGGSVVIKNADAEKGTLGDIREIVNLARDIRDLLKSTPKSSDGDKATVTSAEIREFIALAREVRDLVNETTKSTEAVSVRDLSGLLTTIGPIYEMVKATPEASQEKIGIVEVAAAVALAREIRDLTKAADGAKSVDKIGIAEVAAAVAIAREVKDLFKTLPIDETKGFGVSVGGAVSLPGISAGGSVVIKNADAEKGTLGDIREIVNLARDIRDLLKSTPKSSDGDKATVTSAEIREFIALAREVRDLVNETTKSTEAVSVRDLSGLLTTIGPIYEMVKATPEASQEKIGIVEVAAAVALAREIRDLTKAADGAKSVDKIGIAEVAAAVAIAREVKDLFKTLPIDETKGFGVSVGGAVSLPGISAGGSVVIKDADNASVLSMPKSGQDGTTDLKSVPNRELVQEARFRAIQNEKSAINREIASLLNRRNIDIGTNILELDASTSSLSRPDSNTIDRLPLSDLYKANQDRVKIVYGPDDRKDPSRVKDLLNILQSQGGSQQDIDMLDGQLKNLESVCCVVDRSAVKKLSSGKYLVELNGTYERLHGTCKDERFSEQPLLSYCTGFIVRDDIIATAGHCTITQAQAENACFIFGFQLDDSGTISTSALILEADQVFFGKTLLDREQAPATGSDWALIQIDRKIPGRDNVNFFNGKIPDNHQVYVIGNPIGLPTKIADNAAVTNNSPDAYFQANLDTYGGNSGSPVFSSQSHELVGILVRGGQDFERLPAEDGTHCKKTWFVGNETSGGESVTRASVVHRALDTFLAAVESYESVPVGARPQVSALLTSTQETK
ncbi:trypsin-like serine peptidase [Aureliella helgolandensis]|uniref:Trypsin n=1 Tax=Aureliella helgolandensis TaxID=2527968 RepID=A0A518G9M7_9BACT|nr:serine protease [Aureliella helgolandensis]QDV25282.1 Trypsin [Aureliella helgolandensis]